MSYRGNHITALYSETSSSSLEKGTRVKNIITQKSGVIEEVIPRSPTSPQFYSVQYDDGKFDFRVRPNELAFLDIKEQEDFMHLLHDIVAIGVSLGSLEIRLDSLKVINDPKIFLNSRMKNERYSESLDYPLAKVLYEVPCSVPSSDYFEKKLATLQYLIEEGANPTKLKEQYKFYKSLDLPFLIETKIIDQNIVDYLKTVGIE
jgi:hypothetical protein